MSVSDRFNRAQISEILKRAAELEHENSTYTEDEGLNLEELQQISKEVGIDPKYIRQAVEELNTPSPTRTSTLFGGPFTYSQIYTAPGIIKDENWEEVVSEIRRIHGGIGKTNKLGNTFEWEQRKKEVGYIQISLAPKKDHTKISINANYRYYAFVVSVLSGFGCIPLFTFLANTFSGSPFAPILVFGPIIALLTGVRFYLSRWMKKKRNTYKKLIKRFKELLGEEESQKEAGSISISQQQIQDTEAVNPSSGRQPIRS